ncbi:PAP2 domain protein [Sporothrix schenckii 1099-18]|uniref:PAP2 domain protein n=1 Tax=Sporothrix schenckii 1099-18 TaxID=1397361 RepID=A0A0F2M0N4_SPOSC|nr:PAP2 domain protein [Sporothrix schenckii 1099-18]KJR82634.1 PAP2 domain protein [Sporothrix schenckii 1099-18]
MANSNRWGPRAGHASAWVVASGVVDWLLVVATAIGGFYLGNITPTKRPFQLENPDISFPYTIHETVSTRNLVIATVVAPVATIIVVSLISIPGLSVPPGTPHALLWRRKLWELYASLLSYALGMAAQWFIINGLKNICGKPRPDMLARCQPDILNVAQYVVGGIANITSNGQLVSADICTNKDASVLNDGFRSYLSGHSSSSAAGLGYVALFLAFKFGVVFPFTTLPADRETSALVASAFPSRSPFTSLQQDMYELHDTGRPGLLDGHSLISGHTRTRKDDNRQLRASPNGTMLSTRRSGAAPPLYLLVVALVPFFASIFIAASRWFDFRHHGFDILFGYAIGTVTTLVSFRMYHLPLSRGAGWAWGPRSADKAFWAGVGSHSWAVPWEHLAARTHGAESDYESAVPHNTGSSEAPLSRRDTASRRRAAHEAASNSGLGDDLGNAV